ncbi:hypothetical protein M378DRAFT_168246 [Amanita muscaria Koide BX008]|uniref:Uncharacterized protein n=1 Tax=Amanita muscaria (strain Koide BX008) TaxID=946122 RepID=A0A0C2T1N8_AMAMK|nr:hypothetical protein M378DRAFT_168246 [Amanita muscaria Koide BX008]
MHFLVLVKKTRSDLAGIFLSQVRWENMKIRDMKDGSTVLSLLPQPLMLILIIPISVQFKIQAAVDTSQIVALISIVTYTNTFMSSTEFVSSVILEKSGREKQAT